MPSSIHDHRKKHGHHGYRSLIWMSLLHLPIMYLVMFLMVDTWADVWMNLNTFYMAVTMVAPMLVVMPLTMLAMYPNQRLNFAIYALALGVFAIFLAFTRQQTGIGDRQFIRSMIPHHSGAILMCREADIKDAELKALCDQIMQGQRAEIQKMEQIFKRLN